MSQNLKKDFPGTDSLKKTPGNFYAVRKRTYYHVIGLQEKSAQTRINNKKNIGCELFGLGNNKASEHEMQNSLSSSSLINNKLCELV